MGTEGEHRGANQKAKDVPAQWDFIVKLFECTIDISTSPSYNYFATTVWPEPFYYWIVWSITTKLNCLFASIHWRSVSSPLAISSRILWRSVSRPLAISCRIRWWSVTRPLVISSLPLGVWRVPTSRSSARVSILPRYDTEQEEHVDSDDGPLCRKEM